MTNDNEVTTEPAHRNRTAPTNRIDETGKATYRRDFLKTVCAGAITGIAGTGTAAAATADSEFVETDGTQFVVGDQPIYFSGSNNFWIMDPYADRSLVDRVFQYYDDLGLNLVRTWAFCSGGQGPQCLQPEPGVYNEAGLAHLDYVIHRAKQHGIRLVLPFTDNWSYYGGMDQYVEWVSSANDHADFYTNPECRRLYKQYVETLLTRTNSITGVEYRDDPTIAIWELANEPRAKQDPQGLTKLTNWMKDMSSFIKEIDSNHLLSTGMEGFYATNPQGDWRHDGSHGTAFIEQHKIDTIDACSFHLYPHHWPGLTPIEGADWIKEHLIDAHETVGKPGYCGEFGVQSRAHSAQKRREVYNLWFDTFDQYDANAELIWQLRVSDSSDDGYGVVKGTHTRIIEDIISPYIDRSYQKSGGNTPGPYADATGPASVRRGESAAFDASWSFDPERALSGYEWSFGDGVTGTGENTRHRYDATGSYDVSLTVTDDAGNSATDTESIEVQEIPDGAFVVEGSGEKVHRDVTEFHYAYTRLSGNFTVTARVADMDAISPAAQAGVMLRSDLDTSAAVAATAITPGNGAEFLRSYDAEAPIWRSRPEQGRQPPAWVRLERSDSIASALISTDGSNWTQFASGQVDLLDEVYVGLFVSSHSQDDLCTVQFEDVPWLENWQTTDIGDVQVSGHTTAGSNDSGDSDTSSVEPIDGVMPTDPDGDGLYEDLNANGNIDFDDAVTYFEHMDDPTITDHAAYDYNANGQIDYADLVELLTNVE
jgi:mannan endo-1,4-beta-mannosidase